MEKRVNKPKNPERKPQKRVILFSGPGCIWCVRAKEYFKQKGIRFTVIDVSKDKQAAADCRRHTGSNGIPVILIGSRWIAGFDKAKINKELGL